MKIMDRNVIFVCVVLLVLISVSGCAQTSARDGSQSNDPAQINVRLGLAYLQQGNRELALAKFEHALRLNPKLATAHLYIAEIYRGQGELEKAEEHYRQAEKLDSRDASIKNNYGVFLCDQRRYSEAHKLLLKAAKTRSYEHADEAYENAGMCAQRAGDAKEAESLFREALKINSRRTSSLYQLAKIRYQDKDFSEARDLLLRYSKIAAPTPESLRLAIDIERALGNADQAAQLVDKLHKEFPDSDEPAPFLNDTIQ